MSKKTADEYASSLAAQLRKGYLTYCVMQICAREPRYTSEIISELRNAELVVVEGTIYPLLKRLQNDGVLKHDWQESEQGPPRKYYALTDFGHEIVSGLKRHIKNLDDTLKVLEKGVKK
ncbi:PadR family transcriptional regulator [Candidatus Nomurabacteria bacterium]|nr:PadR family transcriptional regulator [Candidatus Nomurabacteria bacterium]